MGDAILSRSKDYYRTVLERRRCPSRLCVQEKFASMPITRKGGGGGSGVPVFASQKRK